jgi:serine/threonine protein kinase
MDGRRYAVKVVEFGASGFDAGDSVRQAAREVRCLAACDHPHVVRYHASWLEPSWMTGTAPAAAPPPSSSSASGRRAMLTAPRASSDPDDTDSEEGGGPFLDRRRQRRQHLHRLLRTDSPVDVDGLQDLRSLFGRGDGPAPPRPPTSSSSESSSRAFRRRALAPSRRRCGRPARRHSWDAGRSESSRASRLLEDRGSWIEFSGDDSNESRPHSSRRSSRYLTKAARRPKHADPDPYRYQICLFIQMELCAPATLADWIRRTSGGDRPGARSPLSRLGPASRVFRQLARGLAHVHAKGILHRYVLCRFFTPRRSFDAELQLTVGFVRARNRALADDVPIHPIVDHLFILSPQRPEAGQRLCQLRTRRNER